MSQIAVVDHRIAIDSRTFTTWMHASLGHHLRAQRVAQSADATCDSPRSPARGRSVYLGPTFDVGHHEVQLFQRFVPQPFELFPLPVIGGSAAIDQGFEGTGGIICASLGFLPLDDGRGFRHGAP